MTLVTTSRRSTPVIRAIAKDLAFASGVSYLARGKHGLREIAGEHNLFIVIEQQKSEIILTVYSHGRPCLCRAVTTHMTGVREGLLRKGITTTDPDLGAIFGEICQVFPGDGEEFSLEFDGPQKRCMRLTLGYREIHEA